MSEDQGSKDREEMKATVEKKLLGITHTYESIQYQIVSDVLTAISLKTIRDAMMQIMEDNPNVKEVPDMSQVLLLASIFCYYSKKIALDNVEEQIGERLKEQPDKVKPIEDVILSNTYKNIRLNYLASIIGVINQILTINSKQTSAQAQEIEAESLE